MEVSDVLKDAWAAVEAAELPDEIQRIAFQEAVRMLSRASSVGAVIAPSLAISPAQGSESDDQTGPSTVSLTEGVIYDNVVNHTGVDREKLEQLVHMDDGTLRVSVPGLKLGKNIAERARAVAQIITMVRTCGMDEGETSLEVIRAECVRLRVYDGPNFARQVSALSGYVVTGTGKNRRLKPKGSALQAFSAFVDSLSID